LQLVASNACKPAHLFWEDTVAIGRDLALGKNSNSQIPYELNRTSHFETIILLHAQNGPASAAAAYDWSLPSARKAGE
jgi:hypothetical protein